MVIGYLGRSLLSYKMNVNRFLGLDMRGPGGQCALLPRGPPGVQGKPQLPGQVDSSNRHELQESGRSLARRLQEVFLY